MKNLLASVALLMSFSAPALAFDFDKMSDAERSAFRAEVRAYLLDNPSIIIEAYTLYEQQQSEASAANDVTLVQNNAEKLFADARDWVGGNPDGDITLVEFLDYRCGYCRKAHTDVSDLLAQDGNIRLIVKELPILGDESVLASQFAIATKLVAGDAAYKQMHDVLISYRGAFTLSAFAKQADALGLDGQAIADHASSREVSQLINDNRRLASMMSISGTPTFVLEDQMLRGYVPLDGMLELVAAVRDN